MWKFFFGKNYKKNRNKSMLRNPKQLHTVLVFFVQMNFQIDLCWQICEGLLHCFGWNYNIFLSICFIIREEKFTFLVEEGSSFYFCSVLSLGLDIMAVIIWSGWAPYVSLTKQKIKNTWWKSIFRRPTGFGKGCSTSTVVIINYLLP